jgi:hypothetical protein
LFEHLKEAPAKPRGAFLAARTKRFCRLDRPMVPQGPV